jgi:coenzyme F420-reducing hydrogenase alpha subunit
LSSYPEKEQLLEMHKLLDENQENAMRLTWSLGWLGCDRSVKGAAPVYSALIPAQDGYGYFGEVIKTSTGFQANVDEYRHYLNEKVVRYSHAKQSTFEGQPFMVGALARLGDVCRKRLRPTASGPLRKEPPGKQRPQYDLEQPGPGY